MTTTALLQAASLFALLGYLAAPSGAGAGGSVPVVDAKVVSEEEAEGYGGGEELLPGCSWYCGGSVREVRASSALAPQGKASSVAKQAHDFNEYTAWVEGKPDDGVGEWLEYVFQFPSERKGLGVNGLIVVNGYAKSPAVRKANSRVKRLALEVDGKPWAEIRLLDTPRIQTAAFPVVMFPPGREVVLRFRILEVYRGEKYRDTAISEILFEGVGVH
jgi:hypothetical protein